VSFSVLVNGGMTRHFKRSWGLRQGDPLSPYLFIICQEVLSRLIDQEFSIGVIKGVKMNVAGPAFTHVMYVDDIMLFAKANVREVGVLDECLNTYCSWLGQKINRMKSDIIFSNLVDHGLGRELKSLLAMKKVQANAVYLGTPFFQTSSRILDFKFLQEKLEARLLCWCCKALSWAGRATLIKSVQLSLPMYSFSFVDVPVTICEKMDATICRLRWNPSSESSRSLAWKAWANLCTPRTCGGLGFRRVKPFNDVLLAKLTWMIVSGRDSPCFNALQSKYKVCGDWFSKEPTKNASSTWRAIKRLRTTISKGACFIIGDGTSVDCWKDPWVPWLSSFSSQPKEHLFLLIPC
jgi:hypothetical protein